MLSVKSCFNLLRTHIRIPLQRAQNKVQTAGLYGWESCGLRAPLISLWVDKWLWCGATSNNTKPPQTPFLLSLSYQLLGVFHSCLQFKASYDADVKQSTNYFTEPVLVDAEGTFLCFCWQDLQWHFVVLACFSSVKENLLYFEAIYSTGGTWWHLLVNSHARSRQKLSCADSCKIPLLASGHDNSQFLRERSSCWHAFLGHLHPIPGRFRLHKAHTRLSAATDTSGRCPSETSTCECSPGH